MSTALTRDENLAPELRLRTAIEMSLNPKQYTDREDFHELLSCSPSYEESLMAAATDGAYMSVWNMIALSTVVGNPVQSIYPAMNGEKDKIPLYLNKVFSTEENQHRETISIMWSRLGPSRRPTWTPNHFVPVLKKTDQELRPQPKICTSTPRSHIAKGKTITMNDESGNPVRITEVTINHPPIISNVDAEPDDTIAYGCETEDPIHDDSDHNDNVLADCSALNDYTQEASIVNIDSHRETDQHEVSEDVEMSSTYDDTEFVEDQSVPHEDTDDYTLDSTEDIPVPVTAKPLHQGKWHTADELYNIISSPKDVNEDVPPGDKSNCYLLVNNQRNMSRLASGINKKCDFYDDCGTWDHSKGNEMKNLLFQN